MAERAREIVTVHMTSKGSGAYQAALVAKEMAAKELPDLRIEVVDTLQVAMCHGWAAIEAARAALAGASLLLMADASKRLDNKFKILHDFTQGGEVSGDVGDVPWFGRLGRDAVESDRGSVGFQDDAVLGDDDGCLAGPPRPLPGQGAAETEMEACADRAPGDLRAAGEGVEDAANGVPIEQFEESVEGAATVQDDGQVEVAGQFELQPQDLDLYIGKGLVDLEIQAKKGGRR